MNKKYNLEIIENMLNLSDEYIQETEDENIVDEFGNIYNVEKLINDTEKEISNLINKQQKTL